MENASKALIMAGSILISLLVIGVLVFMYNRLADIEQTKTDVDESSKVSDYGKKFEQYNKTIYGSELLSLANLQDDYNRTQTGEKGYFEITIEVTIKDAISGTTFFSPGTKDIEDILTDKNDVEDLIKQYEDTKTARDNNKLYNDRVVKHYSQLSNREIADIYGISYSSGELDYDIGTSLETRDEEVSRLINDINQYKNIKSVYTEFKNKRFRCDRVNYGQTGRVEYMLFVEI